MQKFSAERDADDISISSVKSIKKVSMGYVFLKRSFDILLSLLAIIISAPFFAVILIVIYVTSKGAAIYKQKRVGFGGKEFMIYKFRSMVNGADHLNQHLSPELLKLYQTHRKIKNDPRVTRVGRILRKTSFDELPQIYNIFFGNMSFVGPRPMLPEEKELYGDLFNAYITVKPGLTGLWQIKSRTQTEMEDRARLDYEYLKRRGLLFDLRILIETVAVVFSKKDAC